MTNPEKITDFVIQVPLGRSSTQSVVDLRLMGQAELRALARNLVDVATTDTPWTTELAAIDYMIDGRYAVDQAAAKAAQVSEISALLTSPNAQPGPVLSTPVTAPVSDGTTQRIAELEAQLRDAVAANRGMDAERLQAMAELDRFKAQVVKVAGKYADRHDWCAVVDKALEELDLKRAPQTFTFDMDITITVRATLTDRAEVNALDGEWVRASLYSNQIEDAISSRFEMDSDVEATEITAFEFSIGNVMVEES